MAAGIYRFTVHRCDNRLVAELNGAVIWDQHHHGDPDFIPDRSVDITDRLNPHPTHNILKVKGYNSHRDDFAHPNPWHFAYEVTRFENEQSGVEPRVTVNVRGEDGENDALVYVSPDNTHNIVKLPGE